MKVHLGLSEGEYLFPTQPTQVHQPEVESGGPQWEQSGISATWDLSPNVAWPFFAAFVQSMVRVRAEEVLSAGTWTPLSYPSRGGDFGPNLVHHFEDRSLAAKASAQQKRIIFASATMKTHQGV